MTDCRFPLNNVSLAVVNEIIFLSLLLGLTDDNMQFGDSDTGPCITFSGLSDDQRRTLERLKLEYDL